MRVTKIVPTTTLNGNFIYKFRYIIIDNAYKFDAIDKPAIEYEGAIYYMRNDKLHNNNGPAVILKDYRYYKFKQKEYHYIDGIEIIK